MPGPPSTLQVLTGFLSGSSTTPETTWISAGSTTSPGTAIFAPGFATKSETALIFLWVLGRLGVLRCPGKNPWGTHGLRRISGMGCNNVRVHGALWQRPPKVGLHLQQKAPQVHSEGVAADHGNVAYDCAGIVQVAQPAQHRRVAAPTTHKVASNLVQASEVEAADRRRLPKQAPVQPQRQRGGVLRRHWLPWGSNDPLATAAGTANRPYGQPVA